MTQETKDLIFNYKDIHNCISNDKVQQLQHNQMPKGHPHTLNVCLFFLPDNRSLPRVTGELSSDREYQQIDCFIDYDDPETETNLS